MSSFRSSVRAHQARRLLAITVAAALAVATVIGSVVLPAPSRPRRPRLPRPDFGPNVTIFDPSMPTSQIQAAVDAISAQQIDNEMGTERYSLLFKPGTYGTGAEPLIIQVGYYTEVAGLGQQPHRRHHQRHVDVYNRCLPCHPTIPVTLLLALNNFWRSLSNLTINVSSGEHDRLPEDRQFLGRVAGLADAPGEHQRQSDVDGLLHQRAAVGQRRLHRRLQDRHRHQRIAAAVPGAQQQASAPGRTASGTRSSPACRAHRRPTSRCHDTNPRRQPMPGTYTTLPTNPVSREKPYLYVDSRRQLQRVRARCAGSIPPAPPGQNGPTPGRSIPLSDFYLAKPSDSVADHQRATGQPARTCC